MMTREQYLLGKLAEEASEVAKRALKAQQFGLDEIQKGKDQTNLERTHGELNDLLGIVKMLNDECHFDYEPCAEAIEAKKEKVDRYYDFSASLGRVEKEW